MAHHNEVRIPSKRLHLLWVFCSSFFGVLFLPLILRGALLPVIESQQQPFFQKAFVALVMLCSIITILYLALFALWAFVRLVFNLPALILTLEGIINHSIVYHVVIPWREIDEFIRTLNKPSPSSPRKFGSRGELAEPDILVIEHDQRRLYEQQQPLTRALLWFFNVLRPLNIKTDAMAETPEEVRTQLERCVRETVGDTSVTFTTL